MWQLHTEGMIDSYKVFKIDQAAQRLVYGDSLLALDAQVCPVAPDKTPGQLQTWLHRFVDRTEPTEAAQRHRRAFGDRTVYTSPDEDAMGWLNLCHNQLDLAQVDARLTQMARALGADDPRTIDQRKADLAVDLLLGRIPDTTASDTDTPAVGNGASPKPATGLAKRSETTPATAVTKTPTPSTTIAVVVPIQTLFDESDVPGETVDRQSVVPADVVRQRALEPGTLGAPPGRQAGGVYRLLTDTVGNLLEVTEAGRFPTHKLGFAITCRDGTSFPTSSVPAARCDLDHTVPYARQPDSKDPTGGPTSADNLGPLDRRTHNAKTRGRIGLRQPARASSAGPPRPGTPTFRSQSHYRPHSGPKKCARPTTVTTSRRHRTTSPRPYHLTPNRTGGNASCEIHP